MPLNTPSNPFSPAIGLRSAHLQTLYPALFRKVKAPTITKEMFELEDGDFVEAFWHHKPEKTSNTPIVVLFHGLEGSFDSAYIRGMMHTLHVKDIASVVMHFRGCSGKPNRLARAYHSGETKDALSFLLHVREHYPHSKLFGIGYSLGGNMLLKLLGEQKEASVLDAAISVSAPLELEVCANKMNRGFSKIYQHHLMHSLKPALLRKYQQHSMQKLIGLSEKEVKKLTSFWQYDNAYTAPIHGFSSASEYYSLSSAKQYLRYITTPTLILHALDDPFMTPEIIPEKEELSKSITMEISQYGGHVGFVSGTILKPKYWLEEKILSYIVQYIS